MRQPQRDFMRDMTEIEGERGNFPCPKCGVTMSPNDETDTVYRIIDTKFRTENLEEVVILCNNCGSKIRIVRFLQFTQKCGCTATKPVLFWICSRRMHEKHGTPRVREVNQEERDD